MAKSHDQRHAGQEDDRVLMPCQQSSTHHHRLVWQQGFTIKATEQTVYFYASSPIMAERLSLKTDMT